MTSYAKGILLFCLSTFSHAAEWVPLFDGKSLAGWTKPDGKPPGNGWKVVDGTLHLHGNGGNIVTAKEYRSFELSWTWKISAKGNNGIKYWVTAIGKDWLGPEYQMIDDNGHLDAKIGNKRSTACLYDIKPAAADKPLKAIGEWNESRIVVKKGIIEHHLNGTLVMTIDTAADEWKTLIAASKFKGKAGYAPGHGRIMITDHGDQTWFKEIKILELDAQ